MDNIDIKPCSIDGCNKKRHAKGLCRNHRYRLQKHGDPLGGRTPDGEALKFLEKIIKNPDPDACIIWPFGMRPNGYGMAWKDGKHIGAHRLALILYSGVDYPHLNAAHGECHNRLCVNPLHLSWKTTKENHADKKRDGTAQTGERHGLAKLTEPEVLKILQDQRSHREIAADFGVSRPQISAIKAKRCWAHLSLEETSR